VKKKFFLGILEKKISQLFFFSDPKFSIKKIKTTDIFFSIEYFKGQGETTSFIIIHSLT